ncbi:MAG: bile acid:sodium symporter family protein [Salinivirgaceae bacterium]|nr:bile acid:sodium symporter family protein [Salinivirgaceae bacterium]
MLLKISTFIAKYMAALVLLAAIVALLVPTTFNWVKTSSINYLLGVVMFGMGLSLNLSDFKVVFSRPKDVGIGCLAQFGIMPLLALALARIFSLPDELAVGLVLVGCCPGGTASNVITYLAKGDLALSVGMTCVSTILAPFLTPLLTWLLVGASVNVDVLSMFWSIVKVIILPISVGLVIKRFFAEATKAVTAYLPAVSSIVIVLIVGSVVSANSAQLLSVGLTIIVAVALHNVCGFALGLLLARAFKMSSRKSTAVSVEVGMQNSGLACTLAQTHFATMPMAAVPGAVFSVWHNIAGALWAKALSAKNTENEEIK